MKCRITILACSALLAGIGVDLGGIAAEEVLLEEDFSRPAKGAFLEQVAGSEWHAIEGRLIVGNGQPLDGQALGYAPNRTWAQQVYSSPLSTPVSADEAIELSFDGAVRLDASPEFYNYALRLYEGDDYVQLQLKGSGDAPLVCIETLVAGKKSRMDAEAAYYEAKDSNGLASVRLVISNGHAAAYFDPANDGAWVAAGESLAYALDAIDRVELRYYAMGFWSAMDNLKVAVVAAEPN